MKYFYTVDDIPQIEERSGLRAELFEYFDGNGCFHSQPVDFGRGHIQRCSKNYRGRFTRSQKEMEKMLETIPQSLRGQFTDRGISYTSLLCDWIKDDRTEK